MNSGVPDAAEVLPTRTLLSATSTEVSAFALPEPIDLSETEFVETKLCELPEPEIAVAGEPFANIDEPSAEFSEQPLTEPQFPEIIACALEPGLEIPVGILSSQPRDFETLECWIPESIEDVNPDEENPDSRGIVAGEWIQAENFRGGGAEQPNVLLATMRSHETETSDASDATLTYYDFSDACSTEVPPELLQLSGYAESAWVDPSVGMPVFLEDSMLVQPGIQSTRTEPDKYADVEDVEKAEDLPLRDPQSGEFVVLPMGVPGNVVLARGEFDAAAEDQQSLTPMLAVAMRASTLVSESGSVSRHFRIPVPRFSQSLLPVLQAKPFSFREPGVAEIRRIHGVTDTIAHRESPAWTSMRSSAGEFLRPVSSRRWHRTDRDVASKRTLQLEPLESSRRTPPVEVQSEWETESGKPLPEIVPADVTQSPSVETSAAEAQIPQEPGVENTVAQHP